jgi:hypothetical protein
MHVAFEQQSSPISLRDHLDYHRTLTTTSKPKNGFLGHWVGPSTSVGPQPRRPTRRPTRPRYARPLPFTYSRTMPADFQIIKDQREKARTQIHLKTPSGTWILHSSVRKPQSVKHLWRPWQPALIWASTRRPSERGSRLAPQSPDALK